MDTKLRYLMILSAIILPWALVRLADLEVKVAQFAHHLGDMGMLGLLTIPPLFLLFIQWLLQPRIKRRSSASLHTGNFIKFRG